MCSSLWDEADDSSKSVFISVISEIRMCQFCESLEHSNRSHVCYVLMRGSSHYTVIMIYAVVQVAPLLYKPEVYGFDFRWDYWNFSLT
jgi:recombinational DNA repair protein RecR